MSKIEYGVIIQSGLEDWQIVQQVDGRGSFTLEGRWASLMDLYTHEVQEHYNKLNPVYQVYVAVVDENNSQHIIPWTKADMLEDNKWKLHIADIPAGGLYRVETCLDYSSGNAIQWAHRGDMVHHVGVGDLYVITGQSNSAGYGKDPIYDPPTLGVHLLANSGKWKLAANPLNESTNILNLNMLEHANPGTSPYMSFARKIKEFTGYPIGLIQASRGGSALSEWNISEDGHLYKTMLEIVKSATEKITGILWYQGCSDTDTEKSTSYLERFTEFVNKTRLDLGDENIPFLTFQLNRHISRWRNEDTDKAWARVREAQREASKKIKGVYVIPTLDTTLTDEIHISSPGNMILGDRLANLALKYIYKKNIVADAPDISKAYFTSAKEVKADFDNLTGVLYDYGTPVHSLFFTIEDSKGIVEISDYQISGSSITFILSRECEGDCYIHHAPWQTFAGLPFKDNVNHLPVLAFYGVPVQKN